MKFLLLFLTASVFAAPKNVLTIYTYQDLTGQGSWTEAIQKSFEKKNQVQLKFIGFPSSGEALNQIIIEKENSHADVIMGVDNTEIVKAKKSNLFESDFAAFDYGYLTLVFKKKGDFKDLKTVNFESFIKNPKLKNKIAFIDPRTSSTGLGFYVATRFQHSDEKARQIWKTIAAQSKTIASSWSLAYGLFLKDEVDFVLSYTTSPAYHIEKEKRQDIAALLFEEGHYKQIESAGVLKQSKNKLLAQKFLKYLVSEEAQKTLPTTQWMYPINTKVALPKSFNALPKVEKTVTLDYERIYNNLSAWLKEWPQWIQNTP